MSVFADFVLRNCQKHENDILASLENILFTSQITIILNDYRCLFS